VTVISAAGRFGNAFFKSSVRGAAGGLPCATAGRERFYTAPVPKAGRGQHPADRQDHAAGCCRGLGPLARKAPPPVDEDTRFAFVEQNAEITSVSRLRKKASRRVQRISERLDWQAGFSDFVVAVHKGQRQV